MSYFGIEKLSYCFKIIKKNGGWWQSFMKIYVTDELKDGKLVGTDKFGNKYFENPRYFYTRDRWVEYNPQKYGVDYDSSMICPEWYSWIHHKSDYLPSEDPYRKTHKWVLPYIENVTGTSRAYYPYSTVKSKIHAWDPCRRLC